MNGKKRQGQFMKKTRRSSLPGRVKVFNVLDGQAVKLKHTPYGSVGYCYRGKDMEVVWVRKEAEEIDTSWYSQPTTDHIFIVKGRLKVVFPGGSSTILKPGDLMVLPKNTKCRAYSYPRRKGAETIFLAFYRKPPTSHTSHKNTC